MLNSSLPSTTTTTPDDLYFARLCYVCLALDRGLGALHKKEDNTWTHPSHMSAWQRKWYNRGTIFIYLSGIGLTLWM
jgi:hypothetical protein